MAVLLFFVGEKGITSAWVDAILVNETVSYGTRLLKTEEQMSILKEFSTNQSLRHMANYDDKLMVGIHSIWKLSNMA